jgi:dihydroneopterin aldolase
VLEVERREGQPFVIDLVLGLDTGAAAASDDLRDTVDYGSLVASVKSAVETDPVDLIETLAQRIADLCLLQDRVEWVRVTVHKPDAPIDATVADVALTIGQVPDLDLAEIEDRWKRRLLTLVEDYPEAKKELAELASRQPRGENYGVTQNVTGNTGSVIQVGRDNFGGINTEGR